MDPCGELCDVTDSLSFFRGQLSDDPEDWAWFRWYFCQAGAAPLPLWQAYGHPKWQTDDGLVLEGPGFQYAPFKRRRKRFLVADPQTKIERPSVYAPAAESPHTGHEFRGQPQWYADGVPLADRAADDFGAGCEGEIWGPPGDVPVDGSTDMVEAIGAGGAGGGGASVIFGAPYTTAGGAGGGGTSLVYPDYALGTGGAGGGGASPIAGPTFTTGGGAGGGGTSLVYPDYALGAGGAGGGGASPGYPVWETGEGGAGGGGTSPIVEIPPPECEDAPTFVGATGRYELANTQSFPLPAGVLPGDTLVLSLMGEQCPWTVAVPLPFDSISDGCLPHGDDYWFVYSCVVPDTGMPDPVVCLAGLGDTNQFRGVLIAVRGAGEVIQTAVSYGGAPPAVLPSIDVPSPCAFVLRLSANTGDGSTAFTPDGYAAVDPDQFVTEGWYRPDVPPGPTGTAEYAYGGADDWAAITLAFLLP